MRIAHVVATFPPYWAGTGNVAYQQSRVLHERGYAVEVFTALPAHEQPMDFPFPVHYLKTWGRLGNAPFTPSLIRQLRGFDLIHLHYPYIFGADLTVIAARRYHIPVVATYHNDLLGSGFKGMLFALYNHINQPVILRCMRRIMATTQDYAQNSLLIHITTSSTVAIPLGVDPIFLCETPGDMETDNLAKAYVLFVGAMDAAHAFKGIPLLIDAMAVLDLSNLDLILVGEGELRQSYADYAKDRHLNNVHFLGRVTNENLRRLYKNALVTILPSTSSTEAFGLVLLESWAHKTPVIVSAIPGVRQLVNGGIDGYLVRPGDVHQLSETIRIMAENPRIAKRMGEAGYQKVRTYYTWDRVVDQIEALYREVVQTA